MEDDSSGKKYSSSLQWRHYNTGRQEAAPGWVCWRFCVYVCVLCINIYTPLWRIEKERGQGSQTLTKRESLYDCWLCVCWFEACLHWQVFEWWAGKRKKSFLNEIGRQNECRVLGCSFSGVIHFLVQVALRYACTVWLGFIGVWWVVHMAAVDGWLQAVIRRMLTPPPVFL